MASREWKSFIVLFKYSGGGGEYIVITENRSEDAYWSLNPSRLFAIQWLWMLRPMVLMVVRKRENREYEETTIRSTHPFEKVRLASNFVVLVQMIKWFDFRNGSFTLTVRNTERFWLTKNFHTKGKLYVETPAHVEAHYNLGESARTISCRDSSPTVIKVRFIGKPICTGKFSQKK